jgi:hypothetical protein
METATLPRRERRKFPRLIVSLPLEYRVTTAPYVHGGLVVNASEGGLLIESVKDIPVDTQLVIVVLFPKVYQLASFEVKAEIIWKSVHFKGSWHGWQYGLRFTTLLNEDHQKLTQLLNGDFRLDEVQALPENPPS